MLTKTTTLYFVIASLATYLVAMMGCASGPDRSEKEPIELRTDTDQHPSSYFIDRFTVEKEIPKRPKTTTPFFFKECSAERSRFPSRTSYTCDYPF